MAYYHGVYVEELATGLTPPVEVDAGIPFIVGVAPINMADESNVNKPQLCYSYADAVKLFGYVPPKLDSASGFEKFEYSISEALYSQFALFAVAPIMVVNVLDPAKHKKATETTSITLDSKKGSVTIAETGIIPSTVTLSSYTRGTDYEVSFDSNGNLVIASLLDTDGGFKCTVGQAIEFTAQKLDPSAVTDADIIGGVDTNGKKSGLELVNESFPRFRKTPGFIIAPGYSHKPAVAAVMGAKADLVSSVARCCAVCDVPSGEVKIYSNAPAWKNNNNLVSERQLVVWPKKALDKMMIHGSTEYVGLAGKVDGENSGVPYVSASNHNFQMTQAVLDDGTPIHLTLDEANYLNENGIVTSLNFNNGWVCWGNRTAAYPGTTDIKDAFIPVRRMFDWIGNTLTLTFWSKLDNPLSPRQVNTIVESANAWLAGLTAQGFIAGGRVEFLESDNPITSLMDGKAVFSVKIAPYSPNEAITFRQEYDVNYLSTLFE